MNYGQIFKLAELYYNLIRLAFSANLEGKTGEVEYPGPTLNQTVTVRYKIEEVKGPSLANLIRIKLIIPNFPSYITLIMEGSKHNISAVNMSYEKLEDNLDKLNLLNYFPKQIVCDVLIDAIKKIYNEKLYKKYGGGAEEIEIKEDDKLYIPKHSVEMFLMLFRIEEGKITDGPGLFARPKERPRAICAECGTIYLDVKTDENPFICKGCKVRREAWGWGPDEPNKETEEMAKPTPTANEDIYNFIDNALYDFKITIIKTPGKSSVKKNYKYKSNIFSLEFEHKHSQFLLRINQDDINIYFKPWIYPQDETFKNNVDEFFSEEIDVVAIMHAIKV